MQGSMYSFLMFATIHANGTEKETKASEDLYCFGILDSFLINNVQKVVRFSVLSGYRPYVLRRPNLVVEMLYSATLFGPMGSHATMQHMLATPDVLAGIIVKANFPWNHTNHASNCIILVYYQKAYGQQGPYPPAFVKVLGRPLTSEEILLLQDELGVAESNIHGNGINGCGKCWHANSGDDDVYTFTIPASTMLMGAEGLDYVTIDGAEVKLDTLPGGLIINCKDLMGHIVNIADYRIDREAMLIDYEGYQRKN